MVSPMNGLDSAAGGPAGRETPAWRGAVAPRCSDFRILGQIAVARRRHERAFSDRTKLVRAWRGGGSYIFGEPVRRYVPGPTSWVPQRAFPLFHGKRGRGAPTEGGSEVSETAGTPSGPPGRIANVPATRTSFSRKAARPDPLCGYPGGCPGGRGVSSRTGSPNMYGGSAARTRESAASTGLCRLHPPPGSDSRLSRPRRNAFSWKPSFRPREGALMMAETILDRRSRPRGREPLIDPPEALP
jgi:hypothetical protein